MSSQPSRPQRYRFADFVVSPSRRMLLKRGEAVALIPRYFDLLLLLLARRNEAVHRREILEQVWSDVVVSDGALNQAVRVLRRVLGDDPRSPVFIRTVSRHGYRFIFADVLEESDDTTLRFSERDTEQPDVDEVLETAVRCLLDREADEADQREAAETLHAVGTDLALRRIELRPGHARALALLRDVRWTVPAAGPVPLFGRPGGLAAALYLVGMRARRAVRLAGSRWVSAVAGGGLAGLVGGGLGGVVLVFGPGSPHVQSVLVTLPVVGVTLGALGAAGIGGGLALAEALLRSWRGPALVVGGALGGGVVGLALHVLAIYALQTLFGGDLSRVLGGYEGLMLGGALGLGYAAATPTTEGGMATPRGRARVLAAAIAGACCAAAAVGLAATGSYLPAMSLDFMARSFPGSDVGLRPAALLLGENEPGLHTSMAISGCEGFLFGFGLVLGLTRRPRPGRPGA